MPSPLSGSRQAFFSGQRDVRCEVSGVVSHSEQDPDFTAIQPGHTREIEPSYSVMPARLNRIVILIRYRRCHEAEIEFVSGRPNHGLDSRGFEIQYVKPARFIAFPQLRNNFARSVQAFRAI